VSRDAWRPIEHHSTAEQDGVSCQAPTWVSAMARRPPSSGRWEAMTQIEIAGASGCAGEAEARGERRREQCMGCGARTRGH